MTITALALSAPVFLLSFFMPDKRLRYVFLNIVCSVGSRADKFSDGRNLVEAKQQSGDGKSSTQNERDQK